MLTVIMWSALYVAYIVVGAYVFLVRDVEHPRSATKAMWMLTWWPYYAWRAGWAPL